MDDSICVHFLQWALPKLSMRWKGFRRVRRQVCRRIEKRITQLNIDNLAQYRVYLEHNPDEWHILDPLCRITISRFYRDRAVFDYLAKDFFSALVPVLRSYGKTTLRVWSCGCASGEEPYTIALIWHILFRDLYPDFHLEVIATDIDPVMIKRGVNGCYPMSSLKELPAGWLGKAFAQIGEYYCLKETIKKYVHFELMDIRNRSPGGGFQIILCRNLAFTYFSQKIQLSVLTTIADALEKKGTLLIGTHENLPITEPGFTKVAEQLPFYRKV